MKEHSDAMYVGLKQENGTNRSRRRSDTRTRKSHTRKRANKRGKKNHSKNKKRTPIKKGMKATTQARADDRTLCITLDGWLQMPTFAVILVVCYGAVAEYLLLLVAFRFCPSWVLG